MKKAILSSIIAVIGVAFLSACGNKSGETMTTTTSSTTAAKKGTTTTTTTSSKKLSPSPSPSM